MEYTQALHREVSRRLYQADRGGSCRVPVDERCGMVDRYLTSELERATAFLGAQLTPGEVEEALAEVLLQGPSCTAVQHVLARAGQCAETHAAEMEAALEERAPLNVRGYANRRRRPRPGRKPGWVRCPPT